MAGDEAIAREESQMTYWKFWALIYYEWGTMKDFKHKEWSVFFIWEILFCDIMEWNISSNKKNVENTNKAT